MAEKWISDLVRARGQQLGLRVVVAPDLAPTPLDLLGRVRDAVHGPRRAEVGTFTEESGVDPGGGWSWVAVLAWP